MSNIVTTKTIAFHNLQETKHNKEHTTPLVPLNYRIHLSTVDDQVSLPLGFHPTPFLITF
jgi:hypothetical protein